MNQTLSPENGGTSVRSVEIESYNAVVEEKVGRSMATTSDSLVLEQTKVASYVVTFDYNDPSDPLNWSRRRKWAMVTILSFATLTA